MRLANLILIFAVSINLSLAQNFNYDFERNSEITISGTSNIHDWTSEVTSFSGTADLNIGEEGMIDIQRLEVTIPVNNIKSTKGSIMDGKTYDALKSKKYPNIKYKLNSATISQKTNDGFWLNTSGNLTLAGSTKVISMKVKATMEPNGNIVFEGSKELKMTDFDVSPPTALLGALKTGNEVTIDFKVSISK
jgi:polyisoprenoid-binding protein YceI